MNVLFGWVGGWLGVKGGEEGRGGQWGHSFVGLNLTNQLKSQWLLFLKRLISEPKIFYRMNQWNCFLSRSCCLCSVATLALTLKPKRAEKMVWQCTDHTSDSYAPPCFFFFHLACSHTHLQPKLPKGYLLARDLLVQTVVPLITYQPSRDDLKPEIRKWWTTLLHVQVILLRNVCLDGSLPVWEQGDLCTVPVLWWQR